jgi:4-hydroxy-3-methylbut-2-enyl diphosphate reductase
MTKPIKDIIVAKSAGFCPGVKKAIDIVLELTQTSNLPIYTLGYAHTV